MAVLPCEVKKKRCGLEVILGVMGVLPGKKGSRNGAIRAAPGLEACRCVCNQSGATGPEYAANSRNEPRGGDQPCSRGSRKTLGRNRLYSAQRQNGRTSSRR